MGSQSIAKTIFLLASMVGWLIAGAALMYLSPFLMDLLLPSDVTHLWMTNLSRGGYNPNLALVGGGTVLLLLLLTNLGWYLKAERMKAKG